MSSLALHLVRHIAPWMSGFWRAIHAVRPALFLAGILHITDLWHELKKPFSQAHNIEDILATLGHLPLPEWPILLFLAVLFTAVAKEQIERLKKFSMTSNSKDGCRKIQEQMAPAPPVTIIVNMPNSNCVNNFTNFQSCNLQLVASNDGGGSSLPAAGMDLDALNRFVATYLLPSLSPQAAQSSALSDNVIPIDPVSAEPGRPSIVESEVLPFDPAPKIGTASKGAKRLRWRRKAS